MEVGAIRTGQMSEAHDATTEPWELLKQPLGNRKTNKKLEAVVS